MEGGVQGFPYKEYGLPGRSVQVLFFCFGTVKRGMHNICSNIHPELVFAAIRRFGRSFGVAVAVGEPGPFIHFGSSGYFKHPWD